MSSRKMIDRWVPRLDDKSDDVKEKAATVLAEIATRETVSRNEIIPRLLRIAKTSNYWPLVANSILNHTSEIPKHDPIWLEEFFDAYIHIAAKNQTVSSKNSYWYIHQLLECGAIAKEHPKLLAVYEMAKRRLSIDDDDDIREKLFAIVDWYEDHSSESYSNFSGIKNQLLEPVADSLEPVADSFVWPSTQIFQATTSLADGVFQIDQGVLKMFGYTVGTRGLAEVKRRLILESLYQGQQSSLRGHPQEFEWGDPNSSARLQKLANTIAALTRNAKRKRRSPIAAIRDWENDLEFLKSNYYDGVYDFYWPTTDA